jgi:very-short-patch-repair endonuclease
MPKSLYEHILNLYLEVKTYKNLLDKFKELDELEIDQTKEKQRRNLKYAFESYLRETQDNYTLSFLSTDGFFPSYAMGRESVKAQCIEPLIEVSRSKAVAIRELTPANKLYADNTIFNIEKLNFYKFREKDKNFTPDLIRKQMVFDTDIEAILEFNDIERVGGDRNYKYFGSFEMTDVILKEAQKIDDIRDSRAKVGFRLLGVLQKYHKGGKRYILNDIELKYFVQGKLRLVNLGVVKSKFLGFPICPKCGAVRNPKASKIEIEDFIKKHMEFCRVNEIEEFFSALHTDIQSDLIVIGDFEYKNEAINFMESLKLGAFMVLDMQEGDIDAVIQTKENGKYQIIFYDPLPGGSGFLQLIIQTYTKIIENALKKLNECDCEESCYKCLLSFTNQQYHSILNRFEAVEILEKYNLFLKFSNDIPPLFEQKKEEIEKTDSSAEEKFIKILKSQNFLLPQFQYKVSLNGNEYTVADFAYPDKKILIYIDGLSENIHGNPLQQQKDKLLRAKAKMKGYEIIEISAEGLDDDEYISMVLENIAVYLTQI